MTPTPPRQRCRIAASDAASQPAVPDAPPPLRDPVIFSPEAAPMDDWMHAGHYEELKVWANRRIAVLERELAAANIRTTGLNSQLDDANERLNNVHDFCDKLKAELATLRSQQPASPASQPATVERGGVREIIAGLESVLASTKKREKAWTGSVHQKYVTGDVTALTVAIKLLSALPPQAHGEDPDEPTNQEWLALYDALEFTAKHAGCVSDAHNHVVDKVRSKLAARRSEINFAAVFPAIC